MNSTSNIFGSDQNPAVPGGSLSKPLIIALLAMLALRYPAARAETTLPSRHRHRHRVPAAAIAT